MLFYILNTGLNEKDEKISGKHQYHYVITHRKQLLMKEFLVHFSRVDLNLQI